LNKSKNAKLVTSGFLLGAIFFGGISYAATEVVKLDAYYGVKLIHSGIDKTPINEDQKPFIANGSTYVPLRAVSDILGVDIKWDGENTAVILGDDTRGDSLIMKVYESNNDSNKSDYASFVQDQPMKINDKSYGNKGFILRNSYKNSTATFPLNGQYSSLVATVGYDDMTSIYTKSRQIQFMDQDGKVIHELAVGRGSTHEIKLNVKGILSLKMVIIPNGDLIDSYIDLISPTLIK
jgi:hypothetical protein